MATKSESSGPKMAKAEPEHVRAADVGTTESVESGEERSRDPAGGASEIDPQQIAVLAYQYWEERGRPESSPEQDWFRAEEALRSRAEET